jgi:hypothetical protein
MPRSKSSTVTKVGTKIKAKNKNGKKLCDRGSKCPYQHEYQHNLEYYHEELVTERFPGKVHKLGEAKRTNNNATSSSGFQHTPWTTGRILGTATTTAKVTTAVKSSEGKQMKDKTTINTIGTRNNPIEIKDSQ